MHSIEIKGLVLGEGIPATAVSLTAADVPSCETQLERALDAGVDCLEYRADYFANAHDASALVFCARQLAAHTPRNPLLFTFRTACQGGQATLDAEAYVDLCRAVIADGAVDAIDIESWIGDETVRALCAEARAANLVPVVSHHDFEDTPSVDEMTAMFLHFDELGAGIAKLAVYAHSPADALALMQATDRVRAQADTGPLIAIAMGVHGSITRLVGEWFGSALTFCALDDASAPGQVNLALAKSIMAQLHDICPRG